MRRVPWVVGLATASLVAGLAPLAAPARSSVPTCRGERATIVGTSGADDLAGTRGDDVIVGLGGNDDLRAGRGDDLVCAGPGADRVHGGAGSDHLRGELDLLAEDAGGLFLRGDRLDGGDGDDLLDGGHDSRSGVRRVPDTIAFTDSPTGVAVDLSGSRGTATGHGTDTIRIQPSMGVRGSAFADRILGSDGPDQLDGRAGDDRVEGRRGHDLVLGESVDGGSGHDVLLGGEGNDVLGSYAGRDTVAAGPGDDFVEAYSVLPAVVRAEAGDDYVAQNLTGANGSGSDGGDGRDVLVLFGVHLEDPDERGLVVLDLRSGTTTVRASGAWSGTVGRFQEYRLVGDLRWRFHGSATRDRVWAITGGPLEAWTYGGNDWVHGTPRADVLDGGTGADEVIGAGGDDTCRGAERGRC